MKSLNLKKGFTLIELLAVIVILAVLILIAMPAVLRLMENARRNAFIVEANMFIRYAQTAYAEQSMTTSKKDMCFDLNWLKENGYVDKNLENYSGSVLIKMEAGSGNWSTTSSIWISNGAYFIQNVTSEKIAEKGFGPSAGSTKSSNNCGSATGDVQVFQGTP